MKTALRRSVGLALGALLTASLATPAQAITPSGPPDVQQPVHMTQFGHVMGYVAQTFTATKAGTLADIQLYTATQGLAQIGVLLYAADITSGAPTGDPLGSSGSPRSLSPAGSWQDFAMATSAGAPVTLVSSDRYAIVVPIWSTSVYWWYASGNLYPGGQIWLKMCFSCSWVSGPQGFVNYALLDFAFKVWISAVTTDSTPGLTETSPQDPVTEGSAPSMTGTFFDAGGDAVTVTADHGTVTAPVASSGTWSWTEAPMDEQTTQTVTITATDAGQLSSSKTFTVNVAGADPLVKITNDPVTSPEGSTVTLLATATSPDTDDNHAGFTYEWSVNGGPFGPGTASFSFVTRDEGTYQVTARATDDGGMRGSASVTVVGTDVTPTAKITGVSSSPSLVVAPQEPLTFSGSFSDPAPQDWHVATWDFGDGTTLTTAQIPAGGSTSLSAPHTYAAAGTYTVRLKVADDDGATGVATTTLTVQTPEQALASIAAYVQGLGLNKGETNSLLAKLNAASDAAARGDTNAANNELNAFLNELSADVSSGKVSAASASVLSASVHAVQNALGTRNRFTDWWPLGL